MNPGCRQFDTAGEPGSSQPETPNFNHIARAYRWMEYFTFGPLLEQCRFALIGQLGTRSGDFPSRALILGDGDGRFLANLLRHHAHLTAHVIDISPSMLSLARARTAAVGSLHRVTFQQADLRTLAIPPDAGESPIDLVTAHFVLDCLTTDETASLIQRLSPLLAFDAAFLVSDFAIPPRQPFRLLGSLLVYALYRAFGTLTGLAVRRLPAYGDALKQAGFQVTEERTFLCGMLRSELWRR